MRRTVAPNDSHSLYAEFPETPGVYLMYGAEGALLYIGKAANLKRRVSSYFTRPHDRRIERLVAQIRRIDYRETGTAIEALILEAALIKERQPPFNVREKDDTTFLFVEITREPFPRLLLVRSRDPVLGRRYGPFTSPSSVREALRIVRRIFPYQTHAPHEIGALSKPCFEAQIGLCPGTCVGRVSRDEYRATIRRIALFFEGKKERVVRSLEREMLAASRGLAYERAERLKRQLFALTHIHDVALVSESEVRDPEGDLRAPLRVEGYDISNTGGTNAVGVMVVSLDGRPAPPSYRKFRIRSVTGSNDVAMLREVLDRRLKRDWPRPELILVDGGLAQVGVARAAVSNAGAAIPVIGIAKGVLRTANRFVGRIPSGLRRLDLIALRDEAHRFAVSYHRSLRSRATIPRSRSGGRVSPRGTIRRTRTP